MGVDGGRSAARTVLIALALTLSACGSGSTELTTEQYLQKLEGRPMTTAEIDEQLELADLLCGFQGQVLNEIWDELDARQLEFQDFIFGRHCPDRLPTYAAARPNVGTAPIAATTLDLSLLDKVKELTPSPTTTTTTVASASTTTSR